MKSVPSTRPRVDADPGQFGSFSSGYGLGWVPVTIAGRAGGGLDQPAQRAVGVPLAARAGVGHQQVVAPVGLLQAVGDALPRRLLGRAGADRAWRGWRSCAPARRRGWCRGPSTTGWAKPGGRIQFMALPNLLAAPQAGQSRCSPRLASLYGHVLGVVADLALEVQEPGRAMPGTAPAGPARRCAPEVHSLLSIQTTLPGRVLAQRDGEPLARRVLELGPERRRLVPVEDVEGHDVGRERVPGQDALVQQPVQQVGLAPAGARLLGPVLGRPLGLDLFRLGRRVAFGGLGQAAVGIEVEGLVDLLQRLGRRCRRGARARSAAASSVGQPGVDLAAKLVLVRLQPLLEVGAVQRRRRCRRTPRRCRGPRRAAAGSSGSMSGRRSWW